MPFFKRAQIAAADLALAGLAPADDLHRLTLFADNLVPHVLRIDGVLEFDEDLVRTHRRGTLLEHDSPEEVEIRASRCTPSSCWSQAHPSRPPPPASTTCSGHRGAAPRYKAHPRHRAPTTAY